jgi:hypothetical protein
MLVWRFAILALVGAWIGAMLFFAAVVAPAAFQTLPARELAGGLVGRVLGRLSVAGLVVVAAAGASALAQGALRTGARGWWLRLGVAVAAAAFLVAGLRVSSRLETLRAEMRAGGAAGIDALAEDHPSRLAFGRLHRQSVRLHGGVLILAAILFALEARDIARPRP